MTRGLYANWAVDVSGDVVPGSSVEVRTRAGALVTTLTTDEAGTVPLANPFTADGNGRFEFYALGGSYNVTVGVAPNAATLPVDVLGEVPRIETNADGLRVLVDGSGVAIHAWVDIVVADDGVYSFAPPRPGGFLEVQTNFDTPGPSNTNIGDFCFDVGTNRFIRELSFDSSFYAVAIDLLTDTTLTGTSGVDGVLTVAANDGQLQIENRVGGSRAFRLKVR